MQLAGPTPALAPTPPKLAMPKLDAPPVAPKTSPAAKPPPGSGATAEAASVLSTSVADLVATASGHLNTVKGLTIGGGTKAGTAAAIEAASLLQETSMITQVVHRNLLDVAKRISPELELNLMNVASGLGATSGQVLLMGTKEPVKLSEKLEVPTARAIEVLTTAASVAAKFEAQATKPSSNGYL